MHSHFCVLLKFLWTIFLFVTICSGLSPNRYHAVIKRKEKSRVPAQAVEHREDAVEEILHIAPAPAAAGQES